MLSTSSLVEGDIKKVKRFSKNTTLNFEVGALKICAMYNRGVESFEIFKYLLTFPNINIAQNNSRHENDVLYVTIRCGSVCFMNALHLDSRVNPRGCPRSIDGPHIYHPRKKHKKINCVFFQPKNIITKKLFFKL